MKDIRHIVLKLPELIKEWKYLESILKERGFDFADAPMCQVLEPESLQTYILNMRS